MKVLMLGWEFPPFISGGLGTACYGLTRGLDQLGTKIVFVLPRPVRGSSASHVTLVSPSTAPLPPGAAPAVGPEPRPPRDRLGLEEFENVVFRTVDALLSPYATPQSHRSAVATMETPSAAPLAFDMTPAGTLTPVQVVPREGGPPIQTVVSAPAPDAHRAPDDHYSGDLFAEAQRYAHMCVAIARTETFDVVHAHDWMTFPAGMAVASVCGKPLVIHVHATEFDRSGENVNQRVYDIERQGAHAATRVIAVSHMTRNILISRYGCPADKIEVIYNAISENGPIGPLPPAIRRDEKIVLFLGRITMQKGPEYFIAAAKKVLEVMENVRFVVAGAGDMTRRVIELAAEFGIGHKVLFTGFLRGADVTRIFKMADLYVMPSVSEPFGIAPLEALSNDVPVIISKQSGVAEVLTHALKVDFWDVHEMANKIIAVLRHPPLHSALREHGKFEIRKLTWSDSAEKCLAVYQQALEALRAHRN